MLSIGSLPLCVVYYVIMKHTHDSVFDSAVRLLMGTETVSAAMLQEKLHIGYARAARLLDQLEDAGYVGNGEGGKPRIVSHPMR